MLNFKIKLLDNVVFDQNELISYYDKIDKDYQHMKWTPGNNIDTKTHSVNEMYSWAVQSNLKDPTKPCPPYHIDAGEEISEADNCQTPTELIFGFGKKIIDTFPEVRQLGISGHPPNTKIDLHPDNDEFLKIHIPIITNPDAWFLYEDEKFNMQVGNAYLVNTTILHGTYNQGSTDRIHMIFKFPIAQLETILTGIYSI
jgi:hypothetical protein